jgi:hypothetical protein
MPYFAARFKSSNGAFESPKDMKGIVKQLMARPNESNGEETHICERSVLNSFFNREA